MHVMPGPRWKVLLIMRTYLIGFLRKTQGNYLEESRKLVGGVPANKGQHIMRVMPGPRWRVLVIMTMA